MRRAHSPAVYKRLDSSVFWAGLIQPRIVSSKLSPRAGNVYVEKIRNTFSFNAVRITDTSGCCSIMDLVNSAAISLCRFSSAMTMYFNQPFANIPITQVPWTNQLHFFFCAQNHLYAFAEELLGADQQDTWIRHDRM
jgi:hypothetical protein